MIDYCEHPINIGGSTCDGISPGRGKVRLRLARKDGSEGLILNLSNVYFLPNRPSNLVNLALLNDSNILLDNENETLYDHNSRTVLAQAKRWRNSFILQLLNLSDAAVSLTKIDDETYQWPHIHQTTSAPKLSLTTWHKRLGHLNFSLLKRYLKKLEIEFINNSKDHVCDACQHSKATKVYNQSRQTRLGTPYQYIYTDLVGPITPTGFSGERYFFTFVDDCIRYTETYSGTKKSDWFNCLKAFHNLVKTWTKLERPVEKLRSDYGAELQSQKEEQWLSQDSQEGIVFKPSAHKSKMESQSELAAQSWTWLELQLLRETLMIYFGLKWCW